MKLVTTTMLTLSAFASFTTAASNDDATNIKTCRKANPDVLVAIDAFCNKPDGAIMIPSDYAKAGHKIGHTLVSIDGKCKPAQWLPKKYCLSQFHQICGMGFGAGGFGGIDFGRNNCQRFMIQRK